MIAVCDEQIAHEMAISLLNSNYKNIYFVPEETLVGELPILNESGEFISYIRHISQYKPSLPYVEYHVTDYCNLKCKRCSHFSNLVDEKIFPDIQEFNATLQALQQKFRNIKMFRLMGGEPFLNPDIYAFIQSIRKTFPYADIRIASNGLCLPQIDDLTVKTIRENNVVIDISQYPPTRNMIEKIVQFAWKKKLNIYIGKQITHFFKSIGSGEKQEPEKVYSRCLGRKCHFLRKKYLYPCAAPILYFENKDFLGLNIAMEDVNCNSIDLIDGNESGWDILKKLSSSFDFCKYCTYPEWCKWEISNGEIKRDEYIVES